MMTAATDSRASSDRYRASFPRIWSVWAAGGLIGVGLVTIVRLVGSHYFDWGQLAFGLVSWALASAAASLVLSRFVGMAIGAGRLFGSGAARDGLPIEAIDAVRTRESVRRARALGGPRIYWSGGRSVSLWWLSSSDRTRLLSSLDSLMASSTAPNKRIVSVTLPPRDA